MKNNRYTLITGASEGLGKALALECASRGMNLILVALPGPELESLASLISRNFEVNVHAIGIDLSAEGSCESVFSHARQHHWEVEILINNAGIGSSFLFDQGEISFFEKQIRVNVAVPTILSRLFLAQAAGKSRHFILNVGSMSSFFYLLRKQVYGATKSYIHYFSKSLRKELLHQNVSVSVLCPGSLNTNLALTLVNKTGTYFARLPVLNPEEVAPAAIDGLLRGKQVIIPGRVNKVYMLLDRLLPEAVKTAITNYNMRKIGHHRTLERYIPGSHLTGISTHSG